MIRIVKLTFEPNKIEDFLSIFDESKNKIRAFNGCTHLELLRDINNPSVFFTYSQWETPENLEDYRNSDLFKNVWSKTKILFSEKPEAWSAESLRVIN